MYTLKKPYFLLLLDAKSAFDLIPKESVIVNAFKAGTQDQGLLYLNNRLGNRQTFCEWSKSLMGPIHDNLGVEQGGINSDRLYKLANNNQIRVAQNSLLGVDLGSSVISSIGQADDNALQANSIHDLHNLLILTLDYCERYNVTLVPEKTKLLAFSPPGCETSVEYAKNISPISIDGKSIPFSESGEHVGVIRSTVGNGPSILSRISAHRKAVFSLLSSGLAKNHRANPAASITVERLYGLPVLLSGLATLVLSTPELATLESHFKLHIQNILKLHDGTPSPVIWFLSGCLPFTAQLHLRMMSLFGMITRLDCGRNVLAMHAREVYATARPSSKSWFYQIQKLCIQYGLPHPIMYLDSPPTKSSFKLSVKASIIDYWERRLRGEANLLSEASLKYFKSNFMSLTVTHPVFSSCGSSPYEVAKAKIQARCLSGRARIEALTRHWDPANKNGNCVLCVDEKPSLGSLEHFLLSGGCPALADARLSMIEMMQAFLVPRQHLFPIFKEYWSQDNDMKMQFLLDCSNLPLVIGLAQAYPDKSVIKDLFYVTRTYVAKVFMTRRRLLPLK